MLLWALGTKVLEDAATSPGVAQVAISAISQPLLRYHQSKKRWSANTARCRATDLDHPTCQSTADVLSCLIPLCCACNACTQCRLACAWTVRIPCLHHSYLWHCHHPLDGATPSTVCSCWSEQGWALPTSRLLVLAPPFGLTLVVCVCALCLSLRWCQLHKERDPGGATDILTGECFNTIQCWVEAAPWVVSVIATAFNAS